MVATFVTSGTQKGPSVAFVLLKKNVYQQIDTQKWYVSYIKFDQIGETDNVRSSVHMLCTKLEIIHLAKDKDRRD